MGYDSLSILSKLKKLSAAAVLIVAVSAGLASAVEIGASIQDVSGIRIPDYDPDTGRRVWLVTAEKATADEEENLTVEKPKVILYGKEYDVTVSSKTGLVKRDGAAFKSLVLAGDVVVDMADPQNTVVTTEELEWVAAERQLRSDSVINVRRNDLTITGKGFEMVPEEKGKAFRFIQLKQDVNAEISPEAAQSGVFSGIVGKSVDVTGNDLQPMFITCDGPLTLNSETSALSFSENVKVRRGDFSIRCKEMQLIFDDETHRIKEIRGKGTVEAASDVNGASGDELSWDAATGLIEVIGKPAKTWRGDATVTAPVIWFSEQDTKALWTGRVHLHSPEGEDSLFHFGGTRE